MKKATIDAAVEAISAAIRQKCPEAAVGKEQYAMHGYDATVSIKLPSDWPGGRVLEFEEWARTQAYEMLMGQDVDIFVDAYSLTRNQQELVKWIFLNFPDIQQEHLPASNIEYNRDVARELYRDHEEAFDERFIQASAGAKKDRAYIEKKYRLNYGT